MPKTTVADPAAGGAAAAGGPAPGDLDTATIAGAAPGGGEQHTAGQIAALDRLVADHSPNQDRRQPAAAVDTWIHRVHEDSSTTRVVPEQLGPPGWPV